MALVTIDKLQVIPNENRWDPEYFTSPHRDYIAKAFGRWKRWRPLREAVTKLTSGHTPRFHDVDTGDADFVTVECVSPLQMHPHLYKSVWQDAVKGELARVKLNKGDIVVTIKRRIVDAAVVGNLAKLTAVNQDVAVLVANDEYLPEFFATFLVSRLGKLQAFRNQTEQMNPYLSVGSLGELMVPVVDVDDQKPVADLVRAQSACLERARSLLQYADSVLMTSLGLDRVDVSPHLFFTRAFSDLLTEARFDAEYFNPKYQRVLQKLRNGKRVIADVAPLAERPFVAGVLPKGATFRYIEIGSLTGDGECEVDVLDVADAPSRAAWVVRQGDVITSTVRPIRRLSALIRRDQDGSVCSSGFAVLTRQDGERGIEPEVLLTYLRLPLICDILDLHTTASMYPAIPVDRLMHLPIVVPDRNVRDIIVASVQRAMAARREAERLLERAKTRVQDLIMKQSPA